MSNPDRLVMPSTCDNHGTPGHANFTARNVHGGVAFESHAGDGCVITVPDVEVRRLRERLDEWL